MALYEHVFIARQDLSSSQAEELITKYSDVLKNNGGAIVGHLPGVGGVVWGRGGGPREHFLIFRHLGV